MKLKLVRGLSCAWPMVSWWVILYGSTGLKKDISLFLQLDLSKCSGGLASDNFFLYFFVVAFLPDLILNLVNDQIFFSIMHFRFFFRQIFSCFFVTWFVSGSFFYMIILGRSFSCLQLDIFLGCSRRAPLLSYLPWLGNCFVALFWGRLLTAFSTCASQLLMPSILLLISIIFSH